MKLLCLSSTSAALTIALVIPLVKAQAPLARRRMAFAQDDSKLYIQGGFGSQTFTAQFNALDLSTSWTTASPAWSLLQNGPPASHHAMVVVSPQHAAGLGAGKQGYLLSSGGTGALTFFSTYDLQGATWTNLAPTAVKPPYTGLEGHAAVSDPTTGLVYLVGGYFGNTTYNDITVFDPSTRKVVLQQAATANTSLTDVAAVWSTVRKTVLTFGGSRAPPAASNGIDLKNLAEYDPATKTWKTMTTSGAVPLRRLDHCVAASEDGSKIVLFGGSLDAKTYFYDIYVLDINTAKWTLGTPASIARTRMACGFHSGQFIAFGGSSADNRTSTMHNNIPIIYDISSDTWVNNYEAGGRQPNGGSQPGPSDPSSPSNSTPGSSGSKSNLGPIIGGAAAGVLVLVGCAVAICIVFRRKKRERSHKAAYADAKMAGSSVGDEDERYYRRGPLAPRGDGAGTSDRDRDSEISSSINTSEQNLGSVRNSDHYAAAEALRGGRETHMSGSQQVPRSGYWDSLLRVEDPGTAMRQLP
ncbi:hypothetical protein BGZ54_003011, partial [Gamsiella multidivaricata]